MTLATREDGNGTIFLEAVLVHGHTCFCGFGETTYFEPRPSKQSRDRTGADDGSNPTRTLRVVGVLVSIIVIVLAGAGCATSLNTLQKKSGSSSNESRAASSRTASKAAAGASDSTLRVNDEAIAVEDFWRHEWTKLDKVRRLGEREYRAFVERRSSQLIKDRIAEMLLHQYALLRTPEGAEKQIDKFVDGEIRRIITSQHGGVQRRYEQSLAKQRLTLDDVRTRIRREVVIAGYLEREIKPRVSEPTRMELLSAFNANRDQWRRPARRRMSLIDLRFSRLVSEGRGLPTSVQLGKAKGQAHSIMQTIQVGLGNGTEFAQLARRYSHGLHAEEGGPWGWVDRDSVRERFQPAVDALRQLGPDEVSPVIEAPDALFLVRCDEFEPAVEPSFADYQPQLKQRHAQGKYNELLVQQVEDLRRRARIDPPDLNRFHEHAMRFALEDARVNEYPQP